MKKDKSLGFSHGTLPKKKYPVGLVSPKSGHHKLNSHMSKIDINTCPDGPHGCSEKEDTKHVLLGCPKCSEEKELLRRRVLPFNIPLEETTLLGLISEIRKHTQEKISLSIISYIVETKLVERI